MPASGVSHYLAGRHHYKRTRGSRLLALPSLGPQSRCSCSKDIIRPLLSHMCTAVTFFLFLFLLTTRQYLLFANSAHLWLPNENTKTANVTNVNLYHVWEKDKAKNNLMISCYYDSSLPWLCHLDEVSETSLKLSPAHMQGHAACRTECDASAIIPVQSSSRINNWRNVASQWSLTWTRPPCSPSRTQACRAVWDSKGEEGQKTAERWRVYEMGIERQGTF